MRIIAGEFRSRRLESIPGDATRPTPDRVREALFNILQTRMAGASFVDAYAGTGAVGIEALSRGAAHAWFLERDRRALDAIRKNLASLGVERRATVLAGKVLVTLERCPAGIVFLDPPYDLADEYTGALELLGREASGADDRAALGAPQAEGCVRRTASDADGEARRQRAELLRGGGVRDKNVPLLGIDSLKINGLSMTRRDKNVPPCCFSRQEGRWRRPSMFMMAYADAVQVADSGRFSL